MSGWEGQPPREICIVMLSAIGDAVHVLPVVNALKRSWPESRITWVIQPVPHRLVAGHPAVDEFVVFPRRRGPGAWRSFATLRRALRDRRFDLLLGLQVYLKAGLVTALADADVKLGFDRARARDMFRRWVGIEAHGRGARGSTSVLQTPRRPSLCGRGRDEQAGEELVGRRLRESVGRGRGCARPPARAGGGTIEGGAAASPPGGTGDRSFRGELAG